MKLERVVLIVLDGVGCGELPDAKDYGDPGSNSLGHVAEKYDLKLPNLTRWGLGNITSMRGVTALPLNQCVGSFGKCAELSKGKDTTAGHWEMAGIVVEKAFQTFPNGFSKEIVDRWCRENKLPGVLGNKVASGTDIISELGEEHIRSGKPILYTSADSVWQVAAHEEHFGLDRLLEICKNARTLCDELGISRVIARPFIGKNKADFKRTFNRKDYSSEPPTKTMMEYLVEKKIPVLGIGKIWNIYNGKGIADSIETHGNSHGLETLIEQLKQNRKGLIFVNLIDFDMLYGHRRDVQGYAQALEEFDRIVPELEKLLGPNDLVLVSSDHGNDPTYRGTDHTREYVPLLAYRKGAPASDLGTRQSFADIGQTTLHGLTGETNLLKAGRSFLAQIGGVTS